MDWTTWLIAFMLSANALLVIVVLLRGPVQRQAVLQSDVEGRLRMLTRLSDEERDLAHRALTGMSASRYWYLIGLLDEIEEGRRATDLLRFEAYRYESDASLAS